MMNIPVAIATASRSAKSSRSPSPPPCPAPRELSHTPFKGNRVNYARAEAAVRRRASAPAGGCSPGCQNPPVKFPAPALTSRATMCAEYNGAELFACAAARRVTGGGAGAPPGQPGTTTARSSARPLRGGVIKQGVGCDDATSLPGPGAWGEPSCRRPRGSFPAALGASQPSGSAEADLSKLPSRLSETVV